MALDTMNPEGLGLRFATMDGFLMIDSRSGILERRIEEMDRKLDRLLQGLSLLESK